VVFNARVREKTKERRKGGKKRKSASLVKHPHTMCGVKLFSSLISRVNNWRSGIEMENRHVVF